MLTADSRTTQEKPACNGKDEWEDRTRETPLQYAENPLKTSPVNPGWTFPEISYILFTDAGGSRNQVSYPPDRPSVNLVPLEKVTTRIRLVQPDSDTMATERDFGICSGD